MSQPGSDSLLGLRLADGVTLTYRPDGSAVLTLGDEELSLPDALVDDVVTWLGTGDDTDRSSPSGHLAGTLQSLMADGVLVDAAQASPEALPALPARLGRYKLVKQLEQGSFGVVYEARTDAGLPVAVKLLRGRSGRDLSSLRSEARILGELAHPAVVVPIDFGVDAGRWFVAMELVEGEHFDKAVRQDDRTDVPRLRAALRDLGEAVSAVHAAGILHLDLKPANVLVRPDGHVALLDFGVSRRSGASPRRVGFVGTPAYMAPEVMLRAEAGPESDWYSVGVMLHEALTGTDAPRGDRGPAPRGIDADLWELAGSLLAPDPATRAGGDAVRTVVGGAAAQARPPLPFLGRDAELAELLAAVRPGPARAVMVRGPAGIGRSRLLAELAARAADAGALVLRGRCTASQVPFQALDVLVEPLVHALAGPGMEDCQAQLAIACQAVPALRPFSTGEAPPVERRLEAFQAFAALLRHAAQGRQVALVIDDLHAAGADSVAALTTVLRDDNPVSLIGAARDEPTAFLTAWQDATEAEVVRCRDLHLEPLLPAAARQIARAAGTRDPEELRRVVAFSDGRPSLLEAAVATMPLADESQGAWARRRAAHLPRDVRHVLALVATAREPIALTALHAAAPDEDARRAVHLLAARRWVQVDRRRDGAWIAPYHLPLSDAASADRGPQTDLHRALAGALHGVPGRRGHHLIEAGDVTPAAAAFLEAADSASAAWSFEAAAGWLRRAIATGALSSTAALDARSALARALGGSGHTEQAADTWDALAAESGDPDHRRQAMEAYLVSGQTQRGLDTLTDLLALQGRSWLRSRWAPLALLGDVAAVLWRGSDWPTHDAATHADRAAMDLDWSVARGLLYTVPLSSASHLFRSLRTALRVGDSVRAARAAALVGGGLFAQVPALAGRGRALLTAADAVATRLDDPDLAAQVSMWRGFSGAVLGHWESTAHACQQALTALPRTGDADWERRLARSAITFAEIQRAGFNAVREVSIDALDSAEGRGDRFGRVLARVDLACTDLARGEVREARRRTAVVRSLWTSDAYTPQHFYATAVNAWCALQEGDPAMAAELLSADLNGFRKAGGHRMPMSRIDWSYLNAAISLNGGDALCARPGLQALQRVIDALAREARPDARAWSLAIDAARHFRDGQLERGRALAQHAAERFAAGDMPVLADVASSVAAGATDPACEARMIAAGLTAPDVWIASRLGPAARRHAHAAQSSTQ